MKKQIIILCVVILAASIMAGEKKRCKKYCKCCPPPPPPQPDPPALLVGTWLLNETVSELNSFSVLTVHEDGTSVLHRSLSIEQPAPPNFPIGNYMTIETGIWRTISTTEYDILGTSVVNIVTTGIPQALLSTRPFARARAQFQVTVAENSETLFLNGTINLYSANDLTLFNDPLINETTGLPYLAQVQAEGRRLAFSTGCCGP